MHWDIADAVEEEYYFDHAINVNKIDSNEIDGIVQMKCVVDNSKSRRTEWDLYDQSFHPDFHRGDDYSGSLVYIWDSTEPHVQI